MPRIARRRALQSRPSQQTSKQINRKEISMRLLILGATGGIGRFLVRFALERGHEATAFVRSPQKITLKHERLRVVSGDLLSSSQLAQQLVGQNAVLSAFGPAVLRAITTRRDFGQALAT